MKLRKHLNSKLTDTFLKDLKLYQTGKKLLYMDFQMQEKHHGESAFTSDSSTSIPSCIKHV